MTNLIVLQPSSFCNINCDYCYVPNRLDRTTIDHELLKEIFQKIFNSSCLEDPFRILWHAGEPLALGIPFYERVFKLIDSMNVANKQYRHTIQTNGTLINKEWVDFFRQYNVSVGISIDGPKHLHDSNRKTWSGKGTYEATMRGVRWMKEGNLPLCALCVVTSETLNYGAELFNFFLEAGFSWLGLNVENPWGDHSETTFTQSHCGMSEPEFEERFKSFLSDLYDAWYPYKDQFKIREFSDMFSIFKLLQSDREASPTISANTPCSIITISREGYLTTFSPEMLSGTPSDPNRFIVGNIRELQTLDQIESLPAHQKLAAEIAQGVHRCKDKCSYFSVCGGGTPSSKFYEHGTFDCTQTRDCRYSTQLLADLLIKKAKRITVV